MHTTLNFLHFHAFCLVALLLSGCGGGGSSSTGSATSNAQPNTAPSFVINGNATKGRVLNGKVSAYAISNGQIGSLLTTGETDSQGLYELNFEQAPTGAIVLFIEAKSDGSSYMVCDGINGCGQHSIMSQTDDNQNGLIDFGEQFALEASFNMRAMLDAPQDGMQVSITPLTHLAAEYAQTLPLGLGALSIAQANSQVANVFGLSGDLLRTQPVDVTQFMQSSNNVSQANITTESELAYGLLVASFADMAGNDLTQTLDQWAQTFADQNGQVAYNSQDISLATALSYAANIAQGLGLTNQQTAFDLALQVAQSQLGMTNALPSPSIGQSQFEQVRQLIGSLSQWQNLFTVRGEGDQLEAVLQLITPQMLQALRQAANFIPGLGADSLCSMLQDPFSKIACEVIIQQAAPEVICSLVANMDFGIDVCDITLINNGELIVSYQPLTKTLVAAGLLFGTTEVDLIIDVNHNDAGEVTFSLEGMVDSYDFNAKLALSDSNNNNFALQYEIDSDDLAYEAAATISGSVSAMAEGAFDLDLTYNGIHINTAFTETGLTLTNQDGVSLSIDHSIETNGPAGEITIHGEVYALILYQDGHYQVQYGDGSVEMI